MSIHQNEEEIVNLTSLKKLLSGNSEGIAEVISLFIQHAPTSIDAMKKMVANEQWLELKGQVHSVKSYYGYVGNHALYEELNKWEHALITDPKSYNHAQFLNEIESKTVLMIERLKEELTREL